MVDLILEYGMPTVSWYAEFAFRSRVSMSAIGSVIVMANRPSSPGFPAGLYPAPGPSVCSWSSLPTGLGDAGQLTAVRHRAEADPAQAEPFVDGARPSAAGAPRVAADLELGRPVCLDEQRLLRPSSAPLEGEAEPPQQRATFGVVDCGSHDGDVHPALPIHLVRVDLVEHDLLHQTERVVPVTVELPVGQAAEVADTGQRDGQQAVEELPHAITAQRGVCADRHALTELELSHRLPRLGHRRALPGDGGQVADGTLDKLRVPGRLADAHVHDDLGQAGDLHHVGVAELILERGRDLGPVPLLEPRNRRGFGSHQMSFPLGLATRTLVPSSSTR